MRRGYVTVSTEVDVDVDVSDVLEEVSDAELIEEVKRRDLDEGLDLEDYVLLPKRSLNLSLGSIEQIANTITGWMEKDKNYFFAYLALREDNPVGAMFKDIQGLKEELKWQEDDKK